MATLRLSPTGSLALFLDCPRCFWLQMNKKIKRPRGIFPSLPSGMDLVIKSYFDTFRMKGELPPQIDGQVKGKLFNDEQLLNRWRSWLTTNLKYEDKSLNVSLSGALDDCLIDDDYFIPLDYKTKGSEVKGDPAKYYQHQLDCYCLMLDSNGYKTKGLAYLVYYSPLQVERNGEFTFRVQPMEIATNIESARKLIEDAVAFLKEPLPKINHDCEYCSWLTQVSKVKGSELQQEFTW
ncbi:PD-(D/E)XK nuclease family protein [Candidatus Omnitrophota bacterium]